MQDLIYDHDGVHIEAIPLGHKLYVYLDGRNYTNRDDIDTIALLSPTNIIPTDCVLHCVKGSLNPRVNKELNRVAYELGYRRAFISRACGKRVWRKFHYIETREGFDVYSIDLTPPQLAGDSDED